MEIRGAKGLLPLGSMRQHQLVAITNMVVVYHRRSSVVPELAVATVGYHPPQQFWGQPAFDGAIAATCHSTACIHVGPEKGHALLSPQQTNTFFGFA